MADRGVRTAHLRTAIVLVAIGELYDAEALVVDRLDERPDDVDALRLLAKIKHRRGQLSQAIACWIEVFQLSPPVEPAGTHLRAMLRLAQDPEHGAGDFSALGRFRRVLKPSAQIDLEEAFRLFVLGRPEEAVAHCEFVAAVHRSRDREVYKLAILAMSWLTELCGDLPLAAAALERLGEVRGFETDADRVRALAGLYERLGAPEKLESAVHILRYLERHHFEPGLLARLAVLCRRLELHADAEAYSRHYLGAFRRGMFRPALLDVLAVACQVYLPIDRLRRLELDGLDEPDDTAAGEDLPARGRAILLALRGDADGARALLSAGGEPLDVKYLADLAAMTHDTQHATNLYVDAYASDPDDVRVLVRMLETETRAVDAALRRRLDPKLLDTALDVLTQAVRSPPLRASRWRALARLHTLRDEHDEARDCRRRAADIAAAGGRERRSIGRVLAAGVFHFLGQSVGLIHEVWADREVAPPGKGGTLPSSRVLGNLTPDMVSTVQNTFLSVREYARAKFPHLTGDILAFNYTYKVTKEDEPSGGTSVGLPTAIAFLSVFLQLPVRQDVAFSGVMVSDAHDVLDTRAVGEPAHKVIGAYHRDLRTIVLPAANRAGLEQDINVPAEVQAGIVRYAADLDEALPHAFGPDVVVS